MQTEDTSTEPEHGADSNNAETGAALSAAPTRAWIWRLHFYVGVLAAPLLVLSALSGILYVFFPQAEAVLYKRLYTVGALAGTPALSYDEQRMAVSRAYPSARVKIFVPSTSSTRSTAITIAQPGEDRQEHHTAQTPGDHSSHAAGKVSLVTVYLHPQTGTIAGTLVEENRYRTVIRRAHKTFLAGENGRILTELGTSWLMVLLLTGFSLWFPRKTGQIAGVWRPRFSGASRLRWRDLHTVLGAYALPITLLLAFTGLTWTRFSGEYRRSFQKAIGQESVFRVIAPPSVRAEGMAPIGLDAVRKAAEGAGITLPYKIILPESATGSFTVQTYDPPPFQETRTVFIDQYEGKVLKKQGQEETPPVARFLSMGVALHEGSLFGLANQIVCAMGAGAIVFSVASGLVMWRKRRPAGIFAAPIASPGTRVPPTLLALSCILGALLPTAGVSFLLILLFDWLLLRKRTG